MRRKKTLSLTLTRQTVAQMMPLRKWITPLRKTAITTPTPNRTSPPLCRLRNSVCRSKSRKTSSSSKKKKPLLLPSIKTLRKPLSSKTTHTIKTYKTSLNKKPSSRKTRSNNESKSSSMTFTRKRNSRSKTVVHIIRRKKTSKIHTYFKSLTSH
jgi:hypothetical protein